VAATADAPARPGTSGRSRLRYQPGLDGLRAVAVAAVVIYHFGVSWLPGGFLGVEVFFVISGYLITSLLLGEWRDSGAINLRRFWLRRARRLLPALFVTLVGVSALAVLFAPDAVFELRKAVLAAATYVTNWYQIFGKQSYFQRFGRPPLLRNLWSLAVEEQFYLAWPLLLLLGLKALRGRMRALLTVILGGALASSLLMIVLYHPGTDPSRVYYGTDTRASGLLLGAALAFVWNPSRLSRTVQANARHLMAGVGAAALIALAAIMWRATEFSPFVYQGGMLLVDVLTAVVIAVTVHPALRFGRALGMRPLRWIGERSYSIYLWSWPICALTRPGDDIALHGIALNGLRLLMIGALAEASYRFVETPVRSGALGRWWQRFRETSVRDRKMPFRPLFGLTAAASALLLLGAGLAFGGSASKSDLASSLAAASKLVSTVPPTVATTTSTLPPTTAATAPVTAAPTTVAPTTAPPTTLPPAPHVTAIGDSVMLGAAQALKLRIGNIVVNADVGRQLPQALVVINQLKATNQLGTEVVVHLGTNGLVTDADFDNLMRALQGATKVVVLNTHVPAPWQAIDNTRIAAGVKRWPNAVLLDWNAAAAGHAALFWSDSTHLRPDGAAFYANLVASAL